MTNDGIKELAQEFLGELMCMGVEAHALERMIRRAIEPIPYLDTDKWGQLVWVAENLEIDKLDTPLTAFEMRELMRQNSHRCTGCRKVFAETPEGCAQVSARVFRDNVRTGVLCKNCYGEYAVTLDHTAKAPVMAPAKDD